MAEGATEKQPISIPQRPQQSDFNRWVSDTNDLFELLEHDLRGEVYDHAGKCWKEVLDEPLIAEAGVHFIISEVRVRVNKNTFISNLSDEIIHARVNTLLRVLNQTLFMYGDKLGIEPELIPNITTRVGDIVEFALYRAKDHGERDYYGRSVYVVDQTKRVEGGDFLEHVPVLNRFSASKKRVL